MSHYGGVGPSDNMTREMLQSDKSKSKDKEKEKRRGRRRKAAKQAVKGYKREGGLWEKIKARMYSGASKVKEKIEETK
jgi:hypothetical protein